MAAPRSAPLLTRRQNISEHLWMVKPDGHAIDARYPRGLQENRCDHPLIVNTAAALPTTGNPIWQQYPL